MIVAHIRCCFPLLTASCCAAMLLLRRPVRCRRRLSAPPVLRQQISGSFALLSPSSVAPELRHRHLHDALEFPGVLRLLLQPLDLLLRRRRNGRRLLLDLRREARTQRDARAQYSAERAKGVDRRQGERKRSGAGTESRGTLTGCCLSLRPHLLDLGVEVASGSRGGGPGADLSHPGLRGGRGRAHERLRR